jgi:hypothetical protein
MHAQRRSGHVKRILATLVFLTVLGMADPPANAEEVISVSVWPTIGLSHGDVQVKVVLERNAENRSLIWEVDSPLYYRGSTVQLDGEASPKVWVFVAHDLPEGEFDVRAIVKRSNNKESMALTRMVVLAGRNSR